MPVLDASKSVCGAVAGWLDQIVRERDFGLPLTLPADVDDLSPLVRACLRLVQIFRSDLQQYEAIIASAAESIARNREQIRQAVGDTKTYTGSIAQALSTLRDAQSASQRVASQTEELERDSTVVREASQGAVAELGGAAIDELLDSIQSVKASAASLAETSSGLGLFVDGVARISRRAALLSTNALIEAAHLGSEGRGFGIVATEVRTLADSTKRSVTDINQIAGRLGESTAQVVTAAAQALTAAQKLAGDTLAISDGVTSIDGLVAAFVEPVEAIAAIAAEQQAALPALVSNFERVAELAEATVRASEDASAIDLEGMFASAQSLIGSYRTGRIELPEAAARDDGDALADTIDRIAGGDTAALSELRAAPGDDGAVAAVERFVTSLVAHEREVLASIMRIAVTAGRNSFAWKTIAGNLMRLKELLSASRLALGESRDAAASLSASSQTMQRVASDLRGNAEIPSLALASSVVSLGRVRDNVDHVRAFVTEIARARRRNLEFGRSDLGRDQSPRAECGDRSCSCGARGTRLLSDRGRDSKTRRSHARSDPRGR